MYVAPVAPPSWQLARVQGNRVKREQSAHPFALSSMKI